jgi:hypothetical protein
MLQRAESPLETSHPTTCGAISIERGLCGVIVAPFPCVLDGIKRIVKHPSLRTNNRVRLLPTRSHRTLTQLDRELDVPASPLLGHGSPPRS